MLPTPSSEGLTVIAQVRSFIRIVRSTFRLSSTLVCGAQPAEGPTSGSEA